MITDRREKVKEENKMTFDYTHGQEAKYMVHIYRGFCNDRLYFHSYNEAKKAFEKAKETEKDASISIYNVSKDERKEFVRV